MNEKLNPEVRKMVAEECQPDQTWFIEDGVVRNHALNAWSPSDWIGQMNALTRTAARLAIKTGNAAVYWKALQYIEANDTDALERLVAELKGFV